MQFVGRYADDRAVGIVPLAVLLGELAAGAVEEFVVVFDEVG